MTVDLDDTRTRVKSIIKITRQKGQLHDQNAPLELDGYQLELVSVKINGKLLDAESFEQTSNKLIIKNVPEKFILEIENIINPQDNTALEGLYKSSNTFCTQNEPEGFRAITYYLDRPDVMAQFTTKIIADQSKYPILLSNGNPIGRGELAGGKHWVEWADPFPKPSYLFALVAGDLDYIQDFFKTQSGRTIDLRIFCDKGNKDKCDFAMQSLKKAMKWDEDTFGLEYDLDTYMIVAVDSFNMGAMENKGLNIFNSAYVLADPKTATDDDYVGIEGVIAHEYFHNWTGNRITCRDWFQLTLKEGLTVFRDQQFSADMNSKIVHRINNVNRLKAGQFKEDAGPMSHPIKPSSYIEINNFYTATVYSKGAEVIRMIHTMLGPVGFRDGMDKYFELYDGQAVTTEDFIHAMESANLVDLTQFKNWYHQAGTPEIAVEFSYDEAQQLFKLHVCQTCEKKDFETKKEPYHFPLGFGLMLDDGTEVALLLNKNSRCSKQTLLNKGLLEIKSDHEEFIFNDIPSTPTPSINRNFSAPIKVHAPYSNEQLMTLMSTDTDQYKRFEAGREFSTRLIKTMMQQYHDAIGLTILPEYIKAYGKILTDTNSDLLLKSERLLLPPEGLFHQEQDPINFITTHKAREFLLTGLAKAHKSTLLEMYFELAADNSYSFDSQAVGRRALKNTILGLLVKTGEKSTSDICFDQFKNATNMTDEYFALLHLSNSQSNYTEQALGDFYNKWKHESLVMNKWLEIQSSCTSRNPLFQIKKLMSDPIFDKNVPNAVRALIGRFTVNHIHFNATDGSGYRFISEQVIYYNKTNPQLAAALLESFGSYKKLPPALRKIMGTELAWIENNKKLAKNVYEVLTKIYK